MPAASTPAAAPPLAQQLAWASRAVCAVGQGRSLSDALAQTPQPLRPGVQALAFHALRHWGWSRAVAALLSQRPPSELAQALLCVALALLRHSPQADTANAAPQYPEHTVVDQAVAALALLRQPSALRGFVNACLRRFLRERDALHTHVQAQPQARWGHPAWWVERVQHDHPAHWQAVLQAAGQAAPMVLRINRRQTTQAAYLDVLAQAGVAAQPWGEAGVQLARALPVDRLPGWQQGWVSVQDGAAQLAAPLLLGDGVGMRRVLDACAAPGGKTAHLLELADLDLLALDQDAQRSARITSHLARLQLHAQVRVANAAQPTTWWDGLPYDAILLDAPCTASGIVRRHPDVPWLRRPSDIAQLAAQQAQLLQALWPLLRAGGRLLYSTCSVFKAEGADQIAAFLQQHPDAQALPAPGHLLPAPAAIGDNRSSPIDGFFYALLCKRLS